MNSVKDKVKSSFEIMKSEFGYKNPLEGVNLTKVSISVGTGTRMKKDQKHNDFVVDRLAKITGQKGSLRPAKKSVASFKIRQGDPVGVLVTLRGENMYSFLDKLFNIAFPRTKDFRGIERRVVDNMGNATISIKEHTIFPETNDEELKDVFGFAITIGTTAKSKKEATKFFEIIGLPFKAETSAKK
jgi:large subunit ribosomal protein L5